MKARALNFAISVALLMAVARPFQLAAQQPPYKLINLGTLGGPTSYPSVNRPGYQILGNSGVVAFSADTSALDPLCFFNPDCFISHATFWRDGVLTDLGALPGADNSSGSGAINALGWIAGQSENGEIDTFSGIPEVRAVLWKDDGIIDIGTLGGNFSLATTLNNSGQVVGFATNATPDPFPLFPLSATQTRAFLWQDGEMQDLGTLGGPDGIAFQINQHGQVAGVTYTDPNETPNDTTGIPTIHPFLWDHGTMIDVGTLGGTLSGLGLDAETLLLNDRGQVVGTSSLAGDQTEHPFLWDRGRLIDLGTLGGDNAVPTWFTDTGDVVGYSDLPGSQIHHAFLWHNGVMTDLGTLGHNSTALSANASGQVVGRSVTPSGLRAFLWENDGPMVDLNDLIPSGSKLILEEAENINDGGDILVWAQPPGCPDDHVCGQLVLLVPCNAIDTLACQDSAPNVTAAELSPAALTHSTTAWGQRRSLLNGAVPALRPRLAQRFHLSASTPTE